MKKLILKLFMVAMLAVMSSLDAFSVCNASYLHTVNGLTVSFQNTSTYDYSPNYYWIFGDGTFSTTKDPIKTYATPGYKSVRLYLSDSSGSNLMCASTVLDTVVLVTPQTCVANFTKSISGLTVSITNTSLNGNGTSAGLAYYWYFSEGPQSFLKNPVKNFTSYGVKFIQLQIFDSITNCTSTKMDTLNLSSGPQTCSASFTYNISGLNVSFYNTSISTSSNPKIYDLWNFSDGTSSTARHPNKTFSTDGYKIVKLTMYDSSISCSAVYTDTLYISTTGSSCTAKFSKTATGPFSYSFTNMSTNINGTPNGLTYRWVFSDTTFATTLHANKTFTSTGFKWVDLEIEDPSTGCYSHKSDSFLVSGNAMCNADFIKSVNGLTVTLTNTSVNTNGSSVGLSYFWYFGDGTTSTQKNPVKTYSSGGPKIIHLSISDSSQSCFDTKYDSVFIVAPTPLCSASFTMVIDTTTPFNFFC
jgi:PKD repeat protein